MIHHKHFDTHRIPGLTLLLICIAAHGTFALDIQHGDYSKGSPHHVRVMTWNVLQHLGDPGEPNTAWTASQAGSSVAAINLVVAAMDPDILLFQEIGDIDSSVSYSQALSNLQAWRNANRPGFQLLLSPDGGNIHNAILSRWPFADLNGDGLSTNTDIPTLQHGPGNDWPSGGDGGIRGWLQAEINLPNADYAGDLYIGCSHLKAGSDFNAERVVAAKNIAAYIQYGLNSVGDPLNIIPNVSQPPQALSPLTPVIWAGDFNTAGSNQPVDILRANNPSVANDGTDRDGGTVWRSDSAAAYNGTFHTWGSNSHLDWILVQDSIAQVAATFIFDTARMPRSGSTITQGAPANMVGLIQNANISSIASDHCPVIADIELPAMVLLDAVTITGLSTVTSGGFAQYQAVAHYTDGSQQTVTFQGNWSLSGPASISPSGLLSAQAVAFDSTAELSFEYTDGAVTRTGARVVTILSNCNRNGDVNGDGAVDARDIATFVNVILGLETDIPTTCKANLNADSSVDEADAVALIAALLN